MLSTSVSVIGRHQRLRSVAVGDGLGGYEAIQKDAGLVEKVESLEDISIRHARWVRCTLLVLVLVLAHDVDNRNRMDECA